MDIKTPEERSKNMSAIHSKNTKPEMYFRKLLFAEGYRYSLNSKAIPGHPDIYMRKYNTAIFVHGCFWHRHEGCKYTYMPKSKTEFWINKFETNQKRDLAVKKQLYEKQIKNLIIWECSVRKMQKDKEFQNRLLEEVVDFLVSEDLFMEL